MTDDKRLKAEFEYHTQRTSELLKELREAEAAYGEPINRQNAEQIMSESLEVVRQSGNGALAERARTAYQRFMAAADAVNAAIASDDDAAEALRESMNDTLEEWERINAEVIAWFDYLDSDRKPS